MPEDFGAARNNKSYEECRRESEQKYTDFLKICGRIPFDVSKYTYREILNFLEGQIEKDIEQDKRLWWHTSSILALLININRDPKKTKAIEPKDIYPYTLKKTEQKYKMKMKDLKELFRGKAIWQ